MSESAPQSMFGYFQTQSQSVTNKLFGKSFLTDASTPSQSPYVCKAVFQNMSALAKSYTLRLLFNKSSVTLVELGEWMKGGSYGQHKDVHILVIDELMKARVLEYDSKSMNEEDDDDIQILANIPSLMEDIKDPSKMSNNSKTKVETINENAKLTMNPYFRQNYLVALTSPEEPWSSYVRHKDSIVATYSPSHQEISENSLQKWDALLRFLVKINGAAQVIPGGTIDNFVRFCGLMSDGSASSFSTTKKKGGNVKNLKITAKGYEYMLKSYQEQVWIFVFETIQHFDQGREDLFSLLFMLSYCEFGREYPLNALNETQKKVIWEFAEVGLVYIPGMSGQSVHSVDMASLTEYYFYPSSISINMMFKTYTSSVQSLHQRSNLAEVENGIKKEDKNKSMVNETVHSIGRYFSGTEDDKRDMNDSMQAYANSNTGNEDHMVSITSGLQCIVETNMQVVAYYKSELHLALLNLFVEFHVQMPDMAIGKITRDKVKDAYDMGIRVEQINDFLCVHAHDLVKNETEIIPPNVKDQLVLWEHEKYRIKDIESILVDFSSMYNFTQARFDEVDQYAKKIDAQLFSDASQRIMVLTIEGYDQIESFIEDKYGVI
jgi:hypothetical protein